MKNKIINNPIREEDILYLQDIFLQKGIYYLECKDVEYFKSVLAKILSSLNFYNNSACLSLNFNSNQKISFDIYNFLLTEGYLTNIKELANFFFEKFNFDFLWIESTDQLSNTDWYLAFEQLLLDFGINKSIPIIVIKST